MSPWIINSPNMHTVFLQYVCLNQWIIGHWMKAALIAVLMLLWWKQLFNYFFGIGPMHISRSSAAWLEPNKTQLWSKLANEDSFEGQQWSSGNRQNRATTATPSNGYITANIHQVVHRVLPVYFHMMPWFVASLFFVACPRMRAASAPSA